MLHLVHFNGPWKKPLIEGIDDVIVYIDDILIGENDEKVLLSNRIQGLSKLNEYNLTINEKKLLYSQEQLLILEYILEHGKVTNNTLTLTPHSS